MARVATLAALMTAAVDGVVQLRRGVQQHEGEASLQNASVVTEAPSLVRSLEFKHQLRVCNAFPSGAALEVYRGKEEKLTSDEPMPYKTCRDFSSPLKAGDKLEFMLGDASSGSFSVSDLPNNDAVLLLVVHRHDAASTAVAFESHIFANLPNAQVAVIDTYKGKAHSVPRIIDGAPPHSDEEKAKQEVISKQKHSEELRYQSVVAVNPGIYDVELDDADGKAEAKSQLVALNHESYVVLRMGVEATAGPSYPQELVIFPNPNPAPLLPHSGAAHLGISAVIAACFSSLVVALA